MSEHDPAYCLLCTAGTPHQGLVTLPAERHTVSAGSPGTLVLPRREAAGALADADRQIRALLEDVESILATIEVAEEEILAAQRRHRERPPQRDDTGKITSRKGPLWRAFRLLRPTGAMDSKAEFVYRAHCRDLLDRVARGQDTRPATDVEMVVALCQVGLAVPMHGVAVGL